MLKKFLAVLGLGLLWLFVFSIPVDRDKKVFDLGYSALVDTKPMHWMLNKVRNYFNLTQEAATETVEQVLPRELKKFTQNEGTREQRP